MVERAPSSLFCRKHERAPAARRGGWLSAEKRRRVRNNSADESLDASNVARRLWVGSRPPFDRNLPEFDVLVLCAQEIQPAVMAFAGTVIRCPLPDNSLTQEETTMALIVGKSVAQHLARKHTVLVTCAAGRNRSALVAGLALGLVTQLSADQIVDLVRKRRMAACLSNKAFCDILQRYIGRGRRAPPSPATRNHT